MYVICKQLTKNGYNFFQVYIQPSADEAERVRLSNVADSPISADVPQTMLLNMNGADGDVECKIISPTGREDDCFITPIGDGEHSVRFVPKEEGTHLLVSFDSLMYIIWKVMRISVF